MPDEDCEFDHWEVSGGIAIVDGDATGRFRVSGDGTIKAAFKASSSPPPPQPGKYRTTPTIIVLFYT